MSPRLLLAAMALVALTLSALSEDALPVDPQLARIAAMPLKELSAFTDGVAAAVNQDALRLQGFAQSGDCLNLTRAANSLALAYRYLAEVRDTAENRPEKEAPIFAARAVGVRVVTFASRVRAEEWLAQGCRNFNAPADRASDPRYGVPPRIANAEYTDAVIEARQTAETNLAIAVNAGIVGRCKEAIVAGQNIALLLPYLDKLLSDTEGRPEVLGPRASRRGLDTSRRQLQAALDKLQAQFGEKCKPSGPTPSPDANTPADAGGDTPK